MSGAVVEYSLNLQTALNGDKISAMCLAPSSFGFSYYWNNFFFGTSNGRIYLYNEEASTVNRVTVTGYTGTLSGEITALTTDPAGKYLFVGAPYDQKFMRLSLGGLTTTGNLSLPVTGNIRSFGTNTGGVTVNSQNTVYFVTADGNAISFTDNYGQGLINLIFQQPRGSNSLFTGLVLSADESRFYVADKYTGNIYYFDFTSGENTLLSATAASAQGRITSLAVLSSTSVLYTQPESTIPGVYLYDTEKNTNILVAGGGSNTTSSLAQNYQFINPNQIVVDPQGNLYITSRSPTGGQLFTKVIFNPFVRSPIAAPIPSPFFPNCGIPLPGYCKKIVIPFNPTEYWSFANSQRIPTKRASPSEVRYSCINTVTILCPTIPPSRVNPVPPIPPIPPIAPIYPVETPTSQVTRAFASTGSMTSLRLSVSYTRIVDPSGNRSFVPMSFGPQGYIYFVTQTGVLSVLDTSGGTRFPTLRYSFPQGGVVTRPVVVSSTGLVAITTDLGTLNVIDQTGIVRYTTKYNQQVAGSPVFIDTQNLLIAAYGNTILARNITNWIPAWSNTLVDDKFTTSVITDGVSVFVGTNGGNVVAYSATTGSNYWTYSVGSAPVLRTPVISGNLMAAFVSNIVHVINKTPTRGGGGADTLVTLSGIGTIQASPLLYTDTQATTWLYFTTTSSVLYAAGGFLGVLDAYIDGSGGNIGNFWQSAETTVLATSTPVIDGAASLYVCSTGVSASVYRYPTPPTSARPVASNAATPNLYDIPVSIPGTIQTSPIISSQNKLSFVVFSGGDNYIFTLSS